MVLVEWTMHESSEEGLTCLLDLGTDEDIEPAADFWSGHFGEQEA